MLMSLNPAHARTEKYCVTILTNLLKEHWLLALACEQEPLTSMCEVSSGTKLMNSNVQCTKHMRRATSARMLVAVGTISTSMCTQVQVLTYVERRLV